MQVLPQPHEILSNRRAFPFRRRLGVGTRMPDRSLRGAIDSFFCLLRSTERIGAWYDRPFSARLVVQKLPVRGSGPHGEVPWTAFEGLCLFSREDTCLRLNEIGLLPCMRASCQVARLAPKIGTLSDNKFETDEDQN